MVPTRLYVCMLYVWLMLAIPNSDFLLPPFSNVFFGLFVFQTQFILACRFITGRRSWFTVHSSGLSCQIELHRFVCKESTPYELEHIASLMVCSRLAQINKTSQEQIGLRPEALAIVYLC